MRTRWFVCIFETNAASLYSYSRRGLCLFWRRKIVTWNIRLAHARQAISVRRTTRPSLLARPARLRYVNDQRPGSSASAMTRDLSIAIPQATLSTIATNSRVSMRSRCRRRGHRYGFVPIQTATFSYRTRRARPQTVSLPYAMAKRPRRIKIRAHACVWALSAGNRPG